MHVLSGQSQMYVDAPPGAVYAVVSDITRTPQWSPEVVRARWEGGATGPAAGARFAGTSRSRLLRWTRRCEVLVADPGREFSFRTLYDAINRESTVWRYLFEGQHGGTLVTESYQADGLPTRLIRALSWLLGDRPEDLAGHMQTSLERIRLIVEPQHTGTLETPTEQP